MDFNTILILILIGLFAGIASGFIGIGGGIIIVPCLIYFIGLTQHQAQGLSLTLMLPPIGILAFYTYYKHGQISNTFIYYSIFMAIAFIIGGLIGSKLSLKTPVSLVKLIFGIFMLYISIKMIISGLNSFK